MTPNPPAVGNRPKCLHCGRELRPNYQYPNLPYPNSPEGWKEYHKAKRQGRTWNGTYGPLPGDKFCSGNCAIKWAVRHAKR